MRWANGPGASADAVHFEFRHRRYGDRPNRVGVHGIALGLLSLATKDLEHHRHGNSATYELSVTAGECRSMANSGVGGTRGCGYLHRRRTILMFVINLDDCAECPSEEASSKSPAVR